MPRVLLVDDDHIFVETVVDLLAIALDCDVEVCNLANQALLVLDSSTFAFIMIDWQLADMDGLELLKQIKQKQPNSRVLLSTGLNDQAALESALDAGAEDILRKPFIAGQLIERAKMMLKAPS